ncbi:hypothetical protein KI688_011996 [Linnemannia hyalina]|uniref:Uncharacterized protein n=1 Tax=Linnemannia hyalina TaxID=64524 RepID=A0A9P7XWJ4_9FUNG|nr:hypothetical protein KI688_011996 [Linnemannia hyalina]
MLKLTKYHHYDLSVPDLFKEFVIAPFTTDQIEEYVAQYVPLEPWTWTKEDYMDRLTTIPGLIGLVKNPFLLSLALGAMPAVVESKDNLSRVRVNRVQLYDSFVQHWLRVNKRRLRNQNLKLSRDEQRMIDELLDDGFEERGIKFQADLAAAIFQEQESKPSFIVGHPLSRRSLVTEQSIVQFLAERAQADPEFKRQLYDLLKQTRFNSVYFSPARSAISSSGSQEGSVRVWDLSTEVSLGAPCDRRTVQGRDGGLPTDKIADRH